MIEANHPIRVIIRVARRDFVREANAGNIGELKEMSVMSILSNIPYAARDQFLTFCDECPEENFDRDVSQTQYFLDQRSKLGTPTTREKCHKYKLLLNAMRTNYLNDVGHAPVLVMDGERFARRLDGTHRISILRYLGYKTMPCVCATEQQYSDYIKGSLDKNTVAHEINEFPKWYQSIELLPGLWTHPYRKVKEGEIIPVIQNIVKGKSVIDLGCNNGLYSFESAIAGAREVTGIDRRARSIRQAEFVQIVWELTRPPSGKVEFISGDITDCLDVLNGKDVLIAACVLYHLSGTLHRFMEAVMESGISTLIIQGNHGRAKKSTQEEIRAVAIEGVTKDTPSRLIYDIPQFTQLFDMYGFELVSERKNSSYPVGTYKRKK